MKYVAHFTSTFLLLCAVSFAQDSARQPLGLDELKGYSQAFFYSPGQEMRARSIADLIENAGRFFQKEIGFMPKTEMYILGPHQWRDFAAKPFHNVYGFPHNIDHVRLAVAAEDNDFWQSFLPPSDKLPPAIASKVKKAYGRADGSVSMMPFFDLLALHEIGHSYTAQAGLKMHRNWMGELFVNVMLHTYVAENQPQLLPALETFPDLVVGEGTAGYQFTSLDEFEKLYATMGMGPKNYGWYQCKLHSAAKDIYNAGGKKVMKDLWKALQKHQQEMSDEEFITMLKKEVHPAVAEVYLKWN